LQSPQPKLSSLQRLEKSLSKARLAIRNVIVSGIKVAAAEPATDGSDELFGDVYRNAAVFRRYVMFPPLAYFITQSPCFPPFFFHLDLSFYFEGW
jgi:hypothetical protein